MLVVVPLGPMMYRIVFQPIAEATVLVLLIVSVASHVAMVGLGLHSSAPRLPHAAALGCELRGRQADGERAERSGVCGFGRALIVALALFFGRTIYGRPCAPPRSTATAPA